VDFEPTGESGWLIFNEAWHPDWTALEGGDSREVHRAMLAFSAVQTTGQAGVTFEFRQPWWYNVCAWTSLAGWAVALGLCVFLPKDKSNPL
jgi:hypothetical protein